MGQAMRFKMAIIALSVMSSAFAEEAWFVPGWLRAQEPEELAWNSFTNVFKAYKCDFWKWDGNKIWHVAMKNADAESERLAAALKSMDPARRSKLTLVGHSLGGRIVARTLARLAQDNIKIKRGILLAPAMPADDPDIVKMGAGSVESVLSVVNPDDVTLKYVYAVAGGESSSAYGASGVWQACRNVKEIPVPEDIAKTTEVGEPWGKVEALKEIANHHACFYFEELSRFFEGGGCSARILVPQDNLNFEWKVVGAGIWWDTLDEVVGWKLERNIITRHCRIIDNTKKRKAWGGEPEMRKAFEKIKLQFKNAGK